MVNQSSMTWASTSDNTEYGYDPGQGQVKRIFTRIKEDKSEIPVSVYRFALLRQAKGKGIFGGEKIIYKLLLQDHFCEPKGDGPRATELYRWRSQDLDREFNHFNVSDIVHIRDYLDTIKGVIDGAQTYMAL
jgi:hypothetical protein